MRVIEEKNCGDEYQKNIAYELINLRKLRLFIMEEEQKLALYFERGKESFRWQFPLLNIKAKRTYKRFDIPTYGKSNKGSFYYSLNTPELTREEAFLPIGKVEDDFSKGNAEICHRVGNDCSESLVYQCDRCAGGWYQLPNPACPSGGTKYCGINRCGESGQPACPRGQEFKNYAIQFCKEESSAGFCLPTLNTYCRSKTDLVCL